MTSSTKTQKSKSIIIVTVMAIVGLLLLLAVSAADNSVAVEPSADNSELNVTDSSASGNSYVEFSGSGGGNDGRIPLIVDCDCVNEVDDQFALAYALVRDEIFNVRGVTVNNTGRAWVGGNNVQSHKREAQDIVDIVYGPGKGPPVIAGAETGTKYGGVIGNINGTFQGVEAADFIINEAKKYSPDNKLYVVTIGKVTNAAIALARDPSIASNVHIYSLASNYPKDPDPESNLFQDPAGMQRLIDGPGDFDLFSNWEQRNGAAAIKITRADTNAQINGKGPRISTPVPTQHGPSFTVIGDYLTHLANKANKLANFADARMYDIAPIAVLVDENLGTKNTVGAPVYELRGGDYRVRGWSERPNNPRKMNYWLPFDLDGIRQSVFDSFIEDDEIPVYVP